MDDYGDECDECRAEVEQLRRKLAAAEQRTQRWVASMPVDAIATVIRYTDWNEMPTDEAEADWKKVAAWLAAMRGDAQP